MAVDLILLSQQSLLTEKGKALIDGAINEIDILKNLESYAKRYPDLDLSTLTTPVQSELTDIYKNKNNTKNLTSEQRKAAREQRQADRQEDREQRLRDRLEEFGVENPEQERTRIGAEIAILKAKLRSNKPTNTSFIVTGRLVDTVGGDPIKGAGIVLGYNPNPFGSLPTTGDIGFTGVDSPLTPGDLDVLGNISYDAFINLDGATQRQLTKNLNDYRLSLLSERRAERQRTRIDRRNERFDTEDGLRRDSSTNVILTVGKLATLLEDLERYNELEGVTVEINPNNLLFIPNIEQKNLNYNKDEEESLTNLKQITGNLDDPRRPVFTDENGQFVIKVILPIIPSTQKCPIDVAILSRGGKQRNPEGGYVGKNFMPGTFFLLNGDRTVKTELGIKNVLSSDDASKILSQAYKDKIDSAQATINNIALDQVEFVLSQRKIAINKMSNTIKSKLIPLVIGLLLAFGITKISEANRKTCPTPGELDNVIRRRNRTTRQLNQIYKTIIVNTAIAGAFIALSQVLKGVRLSLDTLPFPQAVGTPPAKDFGGLIFSQPYSTTAKLQRLNELLEELSKSNKDLNKAILTNLVFVIAGSVTVAILLKTIDGLLQECAEENDVTDIELTALNQELLNLSEEEAEDGNPLIKNINGFNLSVETDNKNPVGTLKRRFAVAKDSRGITLLKGEPSFSSSDQILIDELVFYIQQNDLKAF